MNTEYSEFDFIRDITHERRRAKLLVIADVRGWAFDSIARGLKQTIGDAFEIDIIYGRDFRNIADLAVRLSESGGYDFIHFLWREWFFELLSVSILQKELHLEAGVCEAFEKTTASVITSSIYDHLYLTDYDVRLRRNLLRYLDGYSTSSKRLEQIYRIKYETSPTMTIQDAVDTALFSPNSVPKPRNKPRIGWAGNSAWYKGKDNDPKGVHSILIPAIEILRQAGVDFDLIIADRNLKFRPKEEMPEYYRSIDIYVCCSESEGTPNTILEAMSCGLPIVSTDVGIVPEAFGEKQKEFIVDRSPEAVANGLNKLIASHNLRLSLGKENRSNIANWSWSHRRTQWLKFFNSAYLAHKKTRRTLKFVTKESDTFAECVGFIMQANKAKEERIYDLFRT
jgi:glycosyltransferase involved in cell wall biosynthesis